MQTRGRVEAGGRAGVWVGWGWGGARAGGWGGGSWRGVAWGRANGIAIGRRALPPGACAPSAGAVACLLRVLDLPLHPVDRRLRLVLNLRALHNDLARGHLVDVPRRPSRTLAFGLGPLQVAVQLLQRRVVLLRLGVVRAGVLSRQLSHLHLEGLQHLPRSLQPVLQLGDALRRGSTGPPRGASQREERHRPAAGNVRDGWRRKVSVELARLRSGRALCPGCRRGTPLPWPRP